MSAELLLERFGYVAVFFGTFLEGEAILVAAGFFAERGYLDLMMVGLVAFAGAYVGHLFWFWLGRVHGVKLLDRFPKMKQHFGKSIRLFERYGAAAIILTQWLYGLRITCAVLIGMSRIAIVKFLILQAISCALWAGVVTAAGYYFGRAITALLGRAKHLEIWALLAILLVAAGIWFYHQWKDRKERKEAA